MIDRAFSEASTHFFVSTLVTEGTSMKERPYDCGLEAALDVVRQLDEAHLVELFGAPYREYAARVKRWVPGVY